MAGRKGNGNGKGLTAREREVLSHVREGKMRKVIAQDLCVSKRTVDFHLDRIFGKLEVNNRVQAIAVATKLGIFELS